MAADGYPTLTGSPSFEALVDDVVVSADNNVIGGDFRSFTWGNVGSIDVDAGQEFRFQPEFSGVLIRGVLSSFDFTVNSTVVDPNTPDPMTPVPLPAGMPLILAGSGAFAWVRRRQT